MKRQIFLAIFWMLHPLIAEPYKIQLQLADGNGVPVQNTQFWTTVDVDVEEDQITVNFPAIEFQVGPCGENDSDCTSPSPGYLFTLDGFLPPDLRPRSLVPICTLIEQFLVAVDNAGGINIQQAGMPNLAITPGSQAVPSCSITYLKSKREQICSNFALSEGEIDVTEFRGTDSSGDPAGDNIRNSHINDAFQDTLAWAWTDNHNVDPEENILNVFVVIGKIDPNGNIKLGKPVQLTNFPPNTIAWDTSVAINRQDKNNIVVSYGVYYYYPSKVGYAGPSRNCRAVSFDGGETWGGVFDGANSLKYNGEINYQTSGGFDDCPGVRADKYGNFWFGSSDITNDINVPYLLISSDKGMTWNLAFSFNGSGLAPPNYFDDPHLVFGVNGSGQYGVWYYADFYTSAPYDLFPTIAFVPITGLGTYEAADTTSLELPNCLQIPSLAASQDGRFWAMGYSNTSTNNLNLPIATLFKSPGPINANYSGPWLNGFQNQLNAVSPKIYQFDSIPFFGYFLSVQSLIYDDKRQALYGLFSAQNPPLSQHMRLYFSISRNNGQTWSDPYDISTSDHANRGFSSMSLDEENGHISIGWYDGRNDPDKKKLKYFGAIIPSDILSRIVNQIP